MLLISCQSTAQHCPAVCWFSHGLLRAVGCDWGCVHSRHRSLALVTGRHAPDDEASWRSLGMSWRTRCGVVHTTRRSAWGCRLGCPSLRRDRTDRRPLAYTGLWRGHVDLLHSGGRCFALSCATSHYIMILYEILWACLSHIHIQRAKEHRNPEGSMAMERISGWHTAPESLCMQGLLSHMVQVCQEGTQVFQTLMTCFAKVNAKAPAVLPIELN